MKLINSRGRVLLDVYAAEMVGDTILYLYADRTCGGCTDAIGIARNIRAVHRDNPGAREVGALPTITTTTGETQ